MSSVSVRDAMADRQLFARDFGGESWAAWRTVLAGFYALPPEPGDEARFRTLTGRAWPTTPCRELFAIAGRRGGKSRIGGGLLVPFLATLIEHGSKLARGERGVIGVYATDRRQAQVLFGYARAAIAGHPLLRPLVEGERADSIDLRGSITVEIGTADFRRIRGRTLIAALCDEVAFWRSEETANPDTEVLTAIRPALATTGGPLFVFSTPYSRSGALFSTWERHWAKDESPVLVVRAPSRTLNPTLPQRVVDEALADDPSTARAEWLAEWREDIESFVDRDTVMRCVIPGRGDLPRQRGVGYSAFVDPSGGKADSFALCIAHNERGRAVIDVLRERRPPFSPDQITAEFAALCKSFGLVAVTGDKYAAGWVEERFSVYGIRYDRAPLSKSDLYSAALPQLLSKRVELPEAPTLITQLCTLERRTSRGTGRDSIDHSPGARDDVANACMGAVHLVAGRRIARAVSFDLTDLMTGHAGCPKWWPRDWPASWYWEGRPRRESGR